MPVKFNKRAKDKFLAHFREHGLLHLAAKAANVTTETVRNHRKDDPEFSEAYDTALEEFRDELEQEAYRRAVQGVEEDHYFKGDHTHTTVKYSDRLMELLLKRHRPEYRDKITADVNVQGGVLLLPTNELDSKEWEETPDEP